MSEATEAAPVRSGPWAMIDLETAGTRVDAAILQCGIVAFYPDGDQFIVPGSGCEWNVNLMSSVMHGGVPDDGAMDFWRRRPGQWDDLTSYGTTIPALLNNLDTWFAREKPERVWCHGATFDVPILQGYYERLGRKTPWRYGQARCTRTLFEDAETHAGWKRPERETTHLGLMDAVAQAEDVQSAYTALARRGALRSEPVTGSISVSDRFVPPRG